MQTEPFLELFIPDATCFECPDDGCFECGGSVKLLELACLHMVIKWTETLQLVMHPEALVLSFCDHLHCSFAVVNG